MIRILGTFCPSSGLIAFGLLVSMFSLGVLNEEAKAGCDTLCSAACRDIKEPNQNVVCPPGLCAGFFCGALCFCSPDHLDTGCPCKE